MKNHAVCLLLTLALLLLWQSNLAAPSAPANTGFDGARAFASLTDLLQDRRPHVVGSAENARVRDRLVAALRAAGYTPDVQAVFQCSPPGYGPTCAPVENIVAVHKGAGDPRAPLGHALDANATAAPGSAVLVSAHYDSVPAAPGAGDDGAGVAVVLELARALSTRATKNDVVLLISDGEEAGLLGAVAFAQAHPLMARIGAVVNLDARGASGPSLMFETGPGNARLMDLYAGAVAHPAAHSLAYEVYKLLPNDTDFSVYRDRGLTGFNFAFSNSAALYHSANDTLENLSRDTLQHHGDNAFAVTFALADADLAALKSDGDASYFDVFGRALVVWPSAINVPVAGLSLLALIGLIAAYRASFGWRAVAWGAGLVVVVPVLLYALGLALAYPLGIWPGVHPLDHPAPWPARVALIAATFLVAMLAAGFARRGGVSARAIFLVNWLVLGLLALACALTITGAAYALMWPLAAVAIAGWIESRAGRNDTHFTVTAIVGFVGIAFFYVGFFLALDVVIGFDLSQYKLLAMLPFALALVPVLARGVEASGRRPIAEAVALAAVMLVAAGVASQTPAYAANHPRGLNLVYYDDRVAPRWTILWQGAPDETYVSKMGFGATDEAYKQIGLIDAKGRFKPATNFALPAPTLHVADETTTNGVTTSRGTLRSGRGGFFLGIAIPPGSGVRELKVDGQLVLDAARMKTSEPTIARFYGLASRDVPFEITYDGPVRPKITLFERSGLPDADETRALIAARPADAAPAYAGDVSLVFTVIDFAKP